MFNQKDSNSDAYTIGSTCEFHITVKGPLSNNTLILFETNSEDELALKIADLVFDGNQDFEVFRKYKPKDRKISL
jgi:plastocyanin domain-containing protein